jgi:hypothetical protein
MSTTTTHRAVTIGLFGGALWALLPVAAGLASIEEVEFGTLQFAAVAASSWIFLVLAPAMIVVGLTAVRRAPWFGAGRPGRAATATSSIGLGAMALGNAIELASISAGGGTVALGHAVFLGGFLVSVVGGILLGAVLLRRRPGTLARAAALLLLVALPLGIGIGVLGSAVDPANDAWFWAAVSVPTGLAWVLLGRSLSASHAGTREQLLPVS